VADTEKERKKKEDSMRGLMFECLHRYWLSFFHGFPWPLKTKAKTEASNKQQSFP